MNSQMSDGEKKMRIKSQSKICIVSMVQESTALFK